MARLELKGDYQGPGEQKTAERLAAELPDDWVVYVGRKLPGANRDDVDLIVVGNHLVFVLEEKSWGPRLVVDDNNWYVNGEARLNPLNRVAQLARKIAGLLRARARGYKDLRGHLVVPAVVLSHDHLEMFSGAHHDASERILPLAQAATELMQLDMNESPGIRAARESVVGFLSDMPRQGPRPEKLGPYTISGRFAAEGVEVAYEASATDGSRIILKCYDVAELSQHGDPTAFLQRETRALNALADTGRTWRALPFFESQAHRLFVVPLVPPVEGRNLVASVKRLDPARTDGKLDVDIATKVVTDAYRALAEVHELGLAHRALLPSRIWLGRGLRVMFSDFHLAKIQGEQSIGLWAPDSEISDSYRAPECAADVRLASGASDVYALSLSLAYWLLGQPITSHTRDELTAVLVAEWPTLAPVILQGTQGREDDRPTAEQAVEALSAQSAPPEVSAPTPLGPETVDFVVGSIIEGRYLLKSHLGRGGFADTWLVYDQRTNLNRVIKEYRRALPEEAVREFNHAQDLRNEHCGRVIDLQVDTLPHYLVCEYIQGESLAALEVLPGVEELRKVALDIADALGYIHSRDLIHGDVTPSNIIVASVGEKSVLIDFGLSVASGEAPYGGNPKYMAPEIRQGLTISALSDLYGLSASLLTTMLGRLPSVDSASAFGSLATNVLTQAERDQWGPSGVALLSALLSGVEEDPRNRPRSAAELRENIASAEGTTEDVLLEALTNPTVDAIRRLYRASSIGNAGNRGLDDQFAKDTYVPTLLDTVLTPSVIAGDFDAVLLTGNPGDGKTSFLVTLGDGLRAAGAEELSADEAGWSLRLGERTYVCVYDASESHGKFSSDDLVTSALSPVRDLDSSVTALIAVNDGRLFQFFDDHDEFERLGLEVRQQALTGEVGDIRISLIDLKRRSLAAFTDGLGLAQEAVAALTAEPLWEPCRGCSAKTVCPILRNRTLLAASGMDAFGELVLTSHLRRRRRATFRDVRSAAAWLITGDRGCADVHDALAMGRNPLLISDSAIYDLAFSRASGDYLVAEWADFDPGSTAAPLLDAMRRFASTDAGPQWTYPSAATAARALYFGDWAVHGGEREHVRAYRHLPEFLAMLKEPDSVMACRRILLGISRLVGAAGFSGDGLAVNSGLPDEDWTVLHVIPSTDFTLAGVKVASPFVETIPDQLVLEHSAGPKLALALDTAEIILRAADGEVINDVNSDSIRQEIEGFVGQLRRQPAQEANIVDAAGALSRVVISGTKIVLEDV
jgi:serine/threonine protein kinase